MPLESSPDRPQPLRVVTSKVRQWVDRLGTVWVEAQLIEINRRSGARTIFLTLRDRLANVSVSTTVTPAVLDAAGPLTEGATVVARVKPNYYETSGRLSFYCDDISPVGEGRLLARLEHTKRLLQAEGLFDRARKRPLPFLPRVVGLITGADSAAERDVLVNARQRWPAVRIEVVHTLVQGPQAAEQLIAAVQRLDRASEVDVIVLARGGGSLEDLLPFSDEGLVRAVFAARTPVVSAVGHETDTPIVDLVADLRASTPTDAAKRVVPDVAEEIARLRQARERLWSAIDRVLRLESDRLTALRSRPVLADPTATFGLRAEQVADLRARGRRAIAAQVESAASGLEHALARVRAMSPKATLERGYVILTNGSGHAVTSTSDVLVGELLTARLRDGQLGLAVSQREPLESPR